MCKDCIISVFVCKLFFFFVIFVCNYGLFTQQATSTPKRKYKKRRDVDSEEDLVEEEEEVVQCFGPGCIEPARTGSKYCSEQCGMKLANR